MKRRLTFYTTGNASFTSTMAHEEAERVLAAWRSLHADRPSDAVTAMIDGTPVMHIALGSVAAITDEVDS